MKNVLVVLVGILTSFYFFPFEFVFLPGMNTKMLMAGFGLLVIGVRSSVRRDSVIDRDFLSILIYGGLVSLAGFVATVYNGTTDYTYATYVVSMLVWLSSSYVVITAIRFVHGGISVKLVINYLVAVCVAQCILALTMDLYAPLKNFVNSLAGGGDVKMNRLYGLGCSLDVAGTRFAAVLVMIACLCMNPLKVKTNQSLALYLVAFAIIATIGNMIARTTIIGLIIALIYWVYSSGMLRFNLNKEGVRIWKGFLIMLLIFLPVTVYVYHANSIIYTNVRFAFEGFFSLVEKGYWEVHSNERLATMVVFPDNLKTWIIGDGYFNNPLSSDYFYIGRGIGTYYMNTDIGYLRFIFYFGAIGTVIFCLYMLKVAIICAQRFDGYKIMFVFLLLLNYIIWCKVATDVFLVFALFFCIDKDNTGRLEVDS